MHPRSMFFTLYGVYIRHFGGEIALSAAVQLMSEFGFSQPASRVALSRLLNQGWLAFRKEGRYNLLTMTAAGLQRVDEAANRIYRLRLGQWDGQWLLLTYTIPEEFRAARDQLRTDLEWWGFGTLGNGTWISPHSLGPTLTTRLESPELAPYVDYFQARYHGPASDRELVRKGWNLQEMNARYARFLEYFRPEYYEAQATLPPAQACFIARSRLVHEYRKFLFVDPGLPEELLGEDWRGSEAFSLFQSYDRLLAERAGQYFYQKMTAFPGLNLAPNEVQGGLLAQLNPFASNESATL